MATSAGRVMIAAFVPFRISAAPTAAGESTRVFA